ncbi:hypothetical protein [Thermogemmatispora sp.]|uniref:hypothetical protein n=1 Tax=Thermogemmatispora sp. TaxID=1968838 RepID=UPI002579B61A|nr:hypothetical protein [Thermogemmatispora sp.]
MGVDITGWIECRRSFMLAGETTPWQAAISLDFLFHGRNYDAFGCLFGVQNYANFRPVAAEWGLPADVSPRVKEEHQHWDGVRLAGQAGSAGPRSRPLIGKSRQSCRMPAFTGTTGRRMAASSLFEGKAAWDKNFAEAVGHTLGEGIVGRRTWPEGQEWEINSKIYRSDRLRRKDARGSGAVAFAVMEALASNYGDDGVRMIVWFYW